ncbi:MAG: HTH domain-containing protein, partial [Bacteroidales bacterium]|nr:HTH domain-containing protein [Bacteroidales bacterium]
MDQPKIERLLRLMKMMSGSVNYSIDELSDKLDMSPRTIYRYIDTFKEVGFAVEKIHGNVYRIVKYPSVYKDLEKLVYFSDEEAKVVCGLIEGLDSSHALKSALHK